MTIDWAAVTPVLWGVIGTLVPIILHGYMGGAIPILSPILNAINIVANPTTPAQQPSAATPTIGNLIDSLLGLVTSNTGLATAAVASLASPTVVSKIAGLVGGLQTLLASIHAQPAQSSGTPTTPASK